jgi:DNA-binding beta-propeller fold protein YncE
MSEIVPPQVAARLPGHGVAELERSGCVQRDAARSRANGVLVTIDVAKAEALAEGSSGKEARAAVISAVDAGCSPVRGAVTADGGLVYVTARGDDRVLVFDTKKLEDARKLEQDSESPLVRAFATGGAAPVGLRLFDGDKRLLVANSNRFAGGAGSATVLDVNAGAKPQVLQTIRTGEFPRNITASPDGRTLYMTVFGGDELMVLRETQEP